jgi:DNA-binding transcriptional ArsR family regulator
VQEADHPVVAEGVTDRRVDGDEMRDHDGVGSERAQCRHDVAAPLLQRLVEVRPGALHDALQPFGAPLQIAGGRGDFRDARLDPRRHAPEPREPRRGLVGAPQRTGDQWQRSPRRHPGGGLGGLGATDIVETGIGVRAPSGGGLAVPYQINSCHVIPAYALMPRGGGKTLLTAEDGLESFPYHVPAPWSLRPARRNTSVAGKPSLRDRRDVARYGGRMTAMVSAVSIAEIGALVGDAARANMLSALLTGQALTASELGWHAGVMAPTASGHLAKLTAAGLLRVERQGRHRYYRLASPLVAKMLEGLATVAATHSPPRYRPQSRIDEAMRTARTCYDHLAGRLGVALADALCAKKFILLSEDGGVVTRRGEKFFAEVGVDLATTARLRRCFCRPCLDWSERRPHLAGALGAAIADRCFALEWIARMKDTRAVAITRRGSDAFDRLLAIRLDASAARQAA